MESREISAEPRVDRARALPDEWDLSNPKPRLKPRRFEGEAREDIQGWASRRGFGPRHLADFIKIWDAWGPAKDFTRPISSWVGSFKKLANESIDKGTVEVETEEERYRRELESSPLSVIAGGSGDAA